MKVPTRVLSVDEARLFASEAACSPVLELEVGESCQKRCGPILVWRGAERIATLLAAPTVEAMPVPERMRPAYATPAQDANRAEVHLPILPAGDSLRIESTCGAELVAVAAGVSANGAEIAIDAARAGACDTTSAEVVCQ